MARLTVPKLKSGRKEAQPFCIPEAPLELGQSMVQPEI